MFKLFLSTFLITFFLGSSFARPDGAPLEACEHMMPDHFGAPNQEGFPYSIELDKSQVLGNETVHITLATKQGESTGFKGFMIQAREVGATQWRPQGAFNPLVSANIARPLDCAGISASSMTHLSNANKTRVEFEWSPPNTDGNFEIIITIVESRDVFWAQGSKKSIGVTRVNSSSSQFALYAPLLILTLVKYIF